MIQPTQQIEPHSIDRGPSIQTASGPLFYLETSPSEDIRIEDIAHALSNICRFTGHTRKFYSVAQHCVLVSYHVPQEHMLAALLHDAPEAYINDMSRPIKYMRGMEQYKLLESRIWHRISLRFGIPFVLPECVKVADERMLFTEKRDLMPPLDWGYEVEPYPTKITPWNPVIAKRAFLDFYHKILAHNATDGEPR